MNRDQIMRPESMPAEYLVAISCIILFTSMVVPNLALQYQYDIEISYVRSFFGDWPWTVWGLVGLNEFSTDQFWREIHTQLIEWAQLPDSAYQVRWEQIVQQALDNMILLAYRAMYRTGFLVVSLAFFLPMATVLFLYNRMDKENRQGKFLFVAPFWLTIRVHLAQLVLFFILLVWLFPFRVIPESPFILTGIWVFLQVSCIYLFPAQR